MDRHNFVISCRQLVTVAQTQMVFQSKHPGFDPNATISELYKLFITLCLVSVPEY